MVLCPLPIFSSFPGTGRVPGMTSLNAVLSLQHFGVKSFSPSESWRELPK